jgi:hypothetical protein
VPLWLSALKNFFMLSISNSRANFKKDSKPKRLRG